MIRHIVDLFLGAILICGMAFLFAPRPVYAGECQTMVASHYGAESGSRTANGERFNGTSMTAAHKSLPFGAKLRVSYNGRSVVVRVNDRGPYVRGRSLDLSTAAARKIGLTKAGVDRVRVCRVG